MRFSFSPMTEPDARAILAWRYDGPYAVYNMDQSEAALAELLDGRSPYYAACDREGGDAGALAGFFAFGTTAEVTGHATPALFHPGDRVLSVGLGLRPDLTGRGLGLSFVRDGLAFARETFAPAGFRMYVLASNERALRVYERAGFARVGAVLQRTPTGERTFIELQCAA